MVDIIAHSERKNWLVLIRHQVLRDAVASCKAGRVYVTAFQTKRDFRKHAADISWETEVWIAEDPDHMIHFNGDRFLGPHEGDVG